MNSCIALLGQIDGQAVRTVEGLHGPGGAPHAVQEAMAESTPRNAASARQAS